MTAKKTIAAALAGLVAFLTAGQADAARQTAYQYAYIPKTSSPTIYNLLYKRREKCAVGEKKDYPKQKFGACASCPDGTVYMIDDVKNKAYCFKCPAGTLTVKRSGYPMCLSAYPVVAGTAQKPDGSAVSDDELERMASKLGADYKTGLPRPPVEREKTFHNKEPLKNVCPSDFPEDESARKQIDICRRLAEKNDFLCPYVEKNADGKWICRACPKNAPYKNRQGGCFNCPYGEEMTELEDGTPVCASAAPPKKKTVKPAAKKGKSVKKSAKAKKKAASKSKAAVKSKSRKR